MKILHTADWHMNARLGRIDRSAHICRSLEHIAQYLDEYQVDVMLVAGDLFERSHQEQMQKAVGQIKDIFTPFLQRDGTIIVISGNHDSEIFFQTLRDALDLVAPGRIGAHETDAISRLYMAPKARLLKLADHREHIVQFALMPYPTARYLKNEGISYRSLAEKHRAIQDRFTETLYKLEQRIDPKLPSVLVSHIHIRGTSLHTTYRLSENDDIIFEPGDIPSHWAYVAYGHIHKPQPAVAGASNIRYAGSIERLDANERSDDKSVVLIEVGPDGLRGEPAILPLESTPIHQIEITDPDTQIPLLVTQYPDAQDALVSYTLHWQPGKHNRDGLCRQVQDIFPNWYERSFKEIGQVTDGRTTFAATHMQDVAGTVRDYLTTRLEKDPDRAELLDLAETLLAEEV
jgi:exonuclease SbcD